MEKKMKRTVLMICGDYMEDYEVAVPFFTFVAFGFDVHCVSPGKLPGDNCLTAVHDYLGFELYTELPGHVFHINSDFDACNPESYDALVIPGGRFTDLLSGHERTLSVVSSFASAGKPIVTTCHSQLILAAAGLLKGVRCTAFPSMKIVVQLAGGIWSDPEPITSVIADQNVVSAIGWPAHSELIGRYLELMGAKIACHRDKSVLFLCGDFVEDYEINVPFRALAGIGCRVDAASPTKKKGEVCVTAVHDDEGRQVCSEKRGHNFLITANWTDATTGDYDCLVLPGGRSPELLVSDSSVVALVQQFVENGKVVAAIGQGQLVLAGAGILKGKKCASGYGMKAVVRLAGGEVVSEDEASVIDGKLVTATGWPALSNFISDLMCVLGIEVSL